MVLIRSVRASRVSFLFNIGQAPRLFRSFNIECYFRLKCLSLCFADGLVNVRGVFEILGLSFPNARFRSQK